MCPHSLLELLEVNIFERENVNNGNKKINQSKVTAFIPSGGILHDLKETINMIEMNEKQMVFVCGM